MRPLPDIGPAHGRLVVQLKCPQSGEGTYLVLCAPQRDHQ